MGSSGNLGIRTSPARHITTQMYKKGPRMVDVDPDCRRARRAMAAIARKENKLKRRKR